MRASEKSRTLSLAMPKRSLKHVDWQALRDLIAKGATLKDLASAFDIPYRTLVARSYRERWNVAAIRANLPIRSDKNGRKDSNQGAHLNAIRNGVILPMAKLANFWQAADVDTLRSENQRFMSFCSVAIKLLNGNEPDQRQAVASVNLTLLAAPSPLQGAVREVLTTSDVNRSDDDTSSARTG
jgi:hypothetical protein